MNDKIAKNMLLEGTCRWWNNLVYDLMTKLRENR